MLVSFGIAFLCKLLCQNSTTLIHQSLENFAPLNLPPSPVENITTFKNGSSSTKTERIISPTPPFNSIKALIKVRMAKKFGFGTL